MGEIDNKKWIYEALVGKGVNMGSYQDFETNLDANKEWVYNTAKEQGLDMGDYDSFNEAVSTSSPTSVQEFDIVSPTIKMPQSGLAKGTMFEGKSLSQRASDKIGTMPVSPNALFDISVDKYKQEKAWINELQNDPSISSEVRQRILDDYNNNIKSDEYELKDRDLPPTAKEWLARNKEEVTKRRWIPANHKLGEAGYWQEYTEKVNTPEQIEFIKDYMTNSAEGQEYAKSHKDFIAGLENQIDPLLNQIAEMQRASEESKEEYVEKHNISTYALKNTNPQGKALLDKAANLLKETKLRLSANQEGGGFWKGFHFTNEDLKELAALTEGFYNDKALNKAIDKYENNPESLTPEEDIVIQAKYIADQLAAGVDPGSWYNIGQATRQSIPFMRDFMLTTPIGVGAANLTKSAASKLVGKLGAKTLSRGALSKIGKGAIDFTVRPAVQTMFQPSSYAMAFKEMQGQAMDQGDDGKIQFGNRNSFAHGMTSAGIENQAEVLGEIFLDKIFQKLRLPAPAFLKTNAAKKLSHTTGIQGLGSEYLEEKYSDLANIVRGEQTLDEFFDPRSNLETLGTVAVMQIPFKSINATGYGIGKIKDIQAKKTIKTAYNTSLSNLNNSLGAASMDIIPFVNEAIDSGINEDLQNRMSQVIESNSLTDDQKRTIVEYAAIYSAYSGINKAKTEEVEQITQEVTGIVKERVNPDMNALVSATIAGVDTPIQITGGKIVQHEDGSIDRAQSDQEVYYTDADGNNQVVSIQFVEAINESIPTQDAISLATEQVSAPIIAQQENEEAEPRNIGDTIRASVNGERFTGQITGVDKSTGNYIVEVNSPSGIISVPLEPRQIINESNLSGIEAGSDVMYSDAEGNIQKAKVADMESMYASGLIGLDNGAIIPIEDIIGRSQPIEQKFGESEENAITVQAKHGNASESQNSESVIPIDKKGNLLYHQASIETTLADLNDGSLTLEEVDSFITANQTQVNKMLDKVKKTPPKIGINKAKYLADKKAWEEKVNDTQAQADYWKQVAEEVAATREQPGDVTAEAIRSMGEPMSGEELAAMMLGYGNLPILYDSYKKETGGSNSEARGMVGLFATKANGGMTIEEAGEQLMLADLENGTNFFDQNDPNAGRNAIIDVLSGARTRGDLFTYIQRSRGSMAERERQAEYEAYEAWCEEHFHMTPAEYEAYEAVIAEDLAERALTDEEYQDFMSIFVETQINNSNEQQGINRESETGSDVLSGEEPIPSGRTGGIEENSAEVNGSVSDQNGALSESTSNEVNIDENNLNNSEDIVSSHSNNRQTNNNNAEVSESVPQGEHRTLSEKDRGDEEASYQLRRRIEEASGDASTGKKRRNSEQEINRSIETHAKELGMWTPIQKISALGHPFLNGNENEVYLDSEKNVVFKVNNLVNSQTLLNLFKRIDLHNEIFPQTKYELVGITGFGNGSTVYPIYKQSFVSKSTFAIPEDINNYMASLGFKKSGEGKYSNEDITISDLYPRNVLKDSEGDIYVIDAEFKKENKQTVQEHIAREEAKTDTNPTEAQKEAGNYQKGHIKIDGFDITIENPKGSLRSGVDAKGNPWSITMNNTYGYIRETEGVDGDHIDVFLSNNPEEGDVYIVDQINEDGSFDEHKVMYGFGATDQAREAYMANYSPGWKGLGNITGVSKEAFKEWIASSHRKTKPFAKYKIAEPHNTTDLGSIVSEPFQTQINWESPLEAISNIDKGGLPSSVKEEFTAVERLLTEQKGFTFLGEQLTGAPKIKTVEDVAFLFKNLENAVSENVFAVMHKKNGAYDVLYLSTGTPTNSFVDIKQIAAAANEMKAESITVVHNHPSGSLRASRDDIRMHESLKAIGLQINDSVIINLDSGKFVAFSSESDSSVYSNKAPKGKIKPARVYQFDRLKLYKPSRELFKIRSSADVATFLSKQKRGLDAKLHALILDNQNRIVKYAFIDPHLNNAELSKLLIAETGRHGMNVILASNGIIDRDRLHIINKNLNQVNINLLDSLTIKQSDDILSNYISAMDEGVLEEQLPYGKRFRSTKKTYHGSGAIFDKFDTSHFGEGEGESMIGKGIYTTESKKIAKNYANTAKNKVESNKSHLYEVEIPADNGSNYLDYDKRYSTKEMAEIAKRLFDAGTDIGNVFDTYFQSRVASGKNIHKVLSWNIPEGSDVNQILSKAGYVGYKYSTRHDLGGKEKLIPEKSYIVFDQDKASIVSRKQIESQMKDLSDALQTPIRVIRGIEELPEGKARRAIEAGRNIKGWYDPQTKEVVVYLPNAESVGDAVRTVLHEVVGHKGLRQLFGEKRYDGIMKQLHARLPKAIREEVANTANRMYKGNIAVAMDEYLAEQAEKDETPSWWNKVVASFRNFLRKVGLAVELSGNDVKYLLWRSRRNLQQSNLIDYAEDVAMRSKLEIAQFRDERSDRYSRAEQSVRDFTSRYNSADVLVIKNADTAIEQAKASGITDESALAEIKEVASDGDTSAVYSPHYDKILIFAENGSIDYESSLFHENFHRAIGKLELSDAEIEGLFEIVYPTKKQAFNKIIQAYKAIGASDIEAKEECIVYALERGVKLGMDIYPSLENDTVVNKILNFIGYETYESGRNRKIRGRGFQESIELRNNEISQSDGKESGSRGSDTQGIRSEDAGERTEGESAQGIAPKRYREVETPSDNLQAPLPQYAKPPKLADYGGDIQQFLQAYAKNEEDNRKVKTTLAEEVRKAVNKVDGFVTNEIDAQAPVEAFLKVLKKNGGKVSKKSDPYSYSFLSKGSSTFINKEFENKQIKSLTRILSKIVRFKPVRSLNASWFINDIKLTGYQKAYLYLQAKDIQEGIELGLPDRGEQAFIEELGIAHTDYIENFEDAVGMELINELWEKVNAATQFTLNMQLQAGLIERETYDTYNERKFYVPERGWNEREISGNKLHYMNLGGSLNGNPYNAAMLKARGRSSLADNPLPYIQSIAHSTVLSVFKNNTKLRAYNLVLDNLAYGRKHKLFDFKQTWFVQTGEIDSNGNPLYEEVYNRPDKEIFEAKKVRVNPSSLNIVQRTSSEKEQHLVKVIKDGKQYVLEFADERVANALNRNTDDNQTKLGESVAKWTRAMSALMTQYNPSFALWNLARDTGTGLVSNLSEFGMKYTGRFAKNMVNPRVHQAIGQYVFKDKFDKNEHGQLLYDFFMDGAATGWSYLNTIDQLKTDLKKAIDPSMVQQLWGSKYNLVNLEALKFVFGGITEYSELIVRFSEYCTSREMGHTREEAATHAKEVSVNFDRKGSKQNIKSLFAFYNASIQGVNKFARLYCKGKKAKRVLLGTSISLAIGGFLNTLFAPDDPDEERAWGEYDRMQNILIGNARIPLPQFLRLFWGFGVQAALAMRGEKTITQAAFDGVINAFDESLPINVVEVIFGFDEKANSITIFSDAKENLRPIIPTTITPMYDVFTNTTFSGGSVYKEPFIKSQEDKIPQSFLGKRNVHPLAQVFSNSLLELGSGDRNVKSLYKKDGSKVSSMFDINPSVVEHLVTGYIPGVGKFISDLSNTAISTYGVAMGDEDAVIDQTAIPVWNRIVKPYREDKVFFGKFMNLKDITEGYLHGFNERYKAGKNGTLDMDVITKESASDAYKLYIRSLEVLNGIENKNKTRSIIESLPKKEAKTIPESLVKQAEVNKEDIKNMNSLLREWREIR
ncbi:LPD38 domain-containing protein [Bacteroides reticulotermitis]|uniref:putative polyvalent protein kinase domain-containing protein n=1 Tax=Bacteroides reticulotermitis TaxID=1133319 RepID=UPI003A8388D8